MKALLSIVWVSAFMVVPGLGATFAAFGPGEIGFPSRVIVTLGLGYAVTALAGYVLTILHVMHALPFFLLVGAATVAVWHLAVRKGNVRGQGRALVAEFRADPWTLWLGVLVVTAKTQLWQNVRNYVEGKTH